MKLMECALHCLKGILANQRIYPMAQWQEKKDEYTEQLASAAFDMAEAFFVEAYRSGNGSAETLAAMDELYERRRRLAKNKQSEST